MSVSNKDIDQAYCSQRLKNTHRSIYIIGQVCPGHRKNPITWPERLQMMKSTGSNPVVSFCPTIYFYQNICFYQRELFSVVFPKILSKAMNYFRKDLGILRPASPSQKFWRNVNPLELLRVPAALLNISKPIQTFCIFCNPTPLTICGACSKKQDTGDF